jgi:hypothetical protein
METSGKTPLWAMEIDERKIAGYKVALSRAAMLAMASLH